MKSGILNFLEPSGPLQACNGTALPLPGYNMFPKGTPDEFLVGIIISLLMTEKFF
jgi:hypothetical protein